MNEDIYDPYKSAERLAKKKEAIGLNKGICPENKKLILDFTRDAELGKVSAKNRHRRSKPITILKNIKILLILIRFFNKPLADVTSRDMEDFIMALNSGTFKGVKGKPYAPGHRAHIKQFTKMFWKWMKGECKHLPAEVEWIDTREVPSEVSAIPGLLKGVKELVAYAPKLRTKAIIMTLFDSGARRTEFLNLRICDLERGEGEYSDVYFARIRHATSKTRGRTVSLPIASPILAKWLEQHPDKDNSKARLIPIHPSVLNNLLRRLGHKVFGTSVFPHMLRHTSATYYASLLDRATFCRRFGWSYTSSMPDRYIDMAKIDEKKTILAVKGSTTTKLEEENRELSKTVAQLRADQAQIAQNMAKINGFMNQLVENPKLQEQLEALAKKANEVEAGENVAKVL